MENQKCSERGCVFPANGPDCLCGHHRQLFSSESSPGLSIDAEPEDVFSAIFYDKSINVPNVLDRWYRQKEKSEDHKLFSRLSMRRLYRARREAKLCLHCETKIIDLKRTTCDKCNQKVRDLRLGRRNLGLCVSCGQKARSDHIHCIECHKLAKTYQRRHHLKSTSGHPKRTPVPKAELARRNNMRSAERRRRFKELGLCVQCGQVKNNPTTHCDKCRAGHNEHRLRSVRARRGSGVCVTCGAPKQRPEINLCDPCAQKGVQRAQSTYLKRKNSGVCIDCGAVASTLRCVRCNEKMKKRKRRWRAAKKVSAVIRGGGEETHMEMELDRLGEIFSTINPRNFARIATKQPKGELAFETWTDSEKLARAFGESLSLQWSFVREDQVGGFSLKAERDRPEGRLHVKGYVTGDDPNFEFYLWFIDRILLAESGEDDIAA